MSEWSLVCSYKCKEGARVKNKVLFKGDVDNVNSIIMHVKHIVWGWFIARKERNSGVSFVD